MKQLIRKRLLNLIIVLFGVTILSFGLTSLSNNDPAFIIAQQNTLNPTDEQIEEIRDKIGLNEPLMARYFQWIKDAFTGDFGESYIKNTPVIENLARVFPNTLVVGVSAFIVIVIVSIILATFAAIYRDSLYDNLLRMITVIGICIPIFWLGFLMLIIFAVQNPIFSVIPKPGFKGYILPISTLSLGYICTAVRMLRGLLLTELSSDYCIYLKARGISKFQIVTRHTIKNVLPSMITWFAVCAANLIAGVAIVESVFSLNGIGTELINAINSGDLPTISAIVFFIGICFVLFNMIADIINIRISPRYLGGSYEK